MVTPHLQQPSTKCTQKTLNMCHKCSAAADWSQDAGPVLFETRIIRTMSASKLSERVMSNTNSAICAPLKYIEFRLLKRS